MNIIDDVVFAAQWAILEDRFQTRHNAETAAQYLEALEEELTTEQFLLACRRAFRHETFFPSPQCLIDHALGDFLARAEEAWDGIMSRLVGGHELLTDADTIERAVLAKLGGKTMLADASDYGRRDMREQFIRRYARALREKATPQVRAAQPLPEPAKIEPLPALGEARGRTVSFLNMAAKIGVPVEIPVTQAAD